MSAKQASRQDAEPRKKSHSAPLLVIVILASFGVVALIGGQRIAEIDFLGGKVTFQSAAAGGEVTKNDVESSALQEKVAELEASARADAESGSPPSLDLTGWWTANNGMSYRIDQYGDQIVLQEISEYGVTAAGAGVIEGSNVSVPYEAVDGSFGEARLAWADGVLSGVFENYSYGTTVPVFMSR
jgi:hypothetical protein